MLMCTYKLHFTMSVRILLFDCIKYSCYGTQLSPKELLHAKLYTLTQNLKMHGKLHYKIFRTKPNTSTPIWYDRLTWKIELLIPCKRNYTFRLNKSMNKSTMLCPSFEYVIGDYHVWKDQRGFIQVWHYWSRFKGPVV